jgi:hypothetical protein
MHRFDFVKSKPIPGNLFKDVVEGLKIYGIYIPGGDCMIYMLKEKNVAYNTCALDLPQGKYTISYIDPLNGVPVKTETIKHARGGSVTLTLPTFTDDLLLRVGK